MTMKRRPWAPEQLEYLSRAEIEAASEQAVRHFCHPRLDHGELIERLTAYLIALVRMVERQMACRPNDAATARAHAVEQARRVLGRPPVRGCREEARHVHDLSVRVDALLRCLPKGERCPTR
ncbi:MULTISPECIES: DUF6415 family natural product biosynthesis protein [Streptomyces]|uniref:DUF6415 family natural product biosynthesis protein n=1 Tax=Streptomyces TaxID=1883 RepID=UPI00163B8C8B|nr:MULTISPECIES: DUF6415 family natural product biosynthesis protein [Streptomyces]MBC2874046.1 hypothetical protein [Streptomyces sp. TYQ1024]UBI39019.1 DUF6415 family natural product biosynthesis protein [Streptomyces mobaraensis]UKW31597.1 DUF6415 family natural product biosynthesis protein [Streptomyces sp. TYQ1024]